MSLTKEQMREYQRERRAKEKALKKEVVVVIPAVLGKGKKVEVEWDEKKYPNHEMWKDSVGRAERAKRYAMMFPERIYAGDEKYSDVDYQYREEKRIREKKPSAEKIEERTAVKLFEQRCKCGGVWSASIEIACPYCFGEGKQRPRTNKN